MAQMIKIMFNHQTKFYCAFVTIIHEFEADFVDIEFLDNEMIDIVNAPCLSYVGEGYKKLPFYRSVRTRALFANICQIIQHAQYISENENASGIFNEEYIWQN